MTEVRVHSSRWRKTNQASTIKNKIHSFRSLSRAVAGGRQRVRLVNHPYMSRRKEYNIWTIYKKLYCSRNTRLVQQLMN